MRLGVSAFALGLLLAGAEPEELATSVTASLRDVPAIAFGDVIGANVAICLAAVGVGAAVAPLPFGPRVRRYAIAGLPLGAVTAWFSWDRRVGRVEGVVLVAAVDAWNPLLHNRPSVTGAVTSRGDRSPNGLRIEFASDRRRPAARPERRATPGVLPGGTTTMVAWLLACEKSTLAA